MDRVQHAYDKRDGVSVVEAHKGWVGTAGWRVLQKDKMNSEWTDSSIVESVGYIGAVNGWMVWVGVMYKDWEQLRTVSSGRMDIGWQQVGMDMG